MPDNPGRLDLKSRIGQTFRGLLNGLPFCPVSQRYNLTISHEKKFIWFRVAKVGTRTIFSHLRDNEVPLDVENSSDVFYSPRAYDDYFKFGFVRNPWDRLVSCWQNKVVVSNLFEFSAEDHAAMQKFPAFVTWAAKQDIERCDRHMRSQSTLVDVANCDFIGRMESFDDDIRHVFEKIDVPGEEIIPRNVNKRRLDYRAYYDEASIEAVAQMYRADISAFGYEF